MSTSWHCLLNQAVDDNPLDDLRGRMSDNHLCVDCGYDTAPGLWTRAEVEAGFRAGLPEIPQELDCTRSEMFMVRDAVWKRAGMREWDGCLCVGCIEKRLGRRLKPKDFIDRSFNNMPASRRLMARRGDR